jgi:hypothetical protein
MVLSVAVPAVLTVVAPSVVEGVVLLSLKVTVPVGSAPPEMGVTAIVSVSATPYTAVVGEAVSVGEAETLLMMTVCAVLLDALKSESPE